MMDISVLYDWYFGCFAIEQNWQSCPTKFTYFRNLFIICENNKSKYICIHFYILYTVVSIVYKFYRRKLCIFFLLAVSIIFIGKSFIVWSNYNKDLLYTKLLPIEFIDNSHNSVLTFLIHGFGIVCSVSSGTLANIWKSHIYNF